jgi:Transposase DDE domain
MAKLHFFNFLGSTGCYLSSVQAERLILLAFGISQSKSVNMSLVNDQILQDESGCKNEDSQYNWLLKTFQTGNYDPLIRHSFQLVVLYFYSGQPEVQLVIDRTNWDFGAERINVLTIGLLTDNQLFIPLVWEDLHYKGNSHSKIRLALIDRLLNWWRALDIPVPTFEICGDREFIGEYWLTELARRGINYIIRLRSDLSFETWLNDTYKVDKRFTVPCLHRYMQLYKKQTVEVVLQNEAVAQVFVVKNDGNDTKQEPYIYFITNLDNIDQAALHYRKRWKIEVFFKYMKTQGFNLEDFNMSGAHKVNILMAVLSMVLIIVIEAEKTQQTTTQNQQINQQAKEKKQGKKYCKYQNDKIYPRKSTFRRGITAVTKIRTVENFIRLCNEMMKKIIDNWKVLNELHIKSLTVQ